MVSSSYTNEVQSSEMNFEPHFLFNGYQKIFSISKSVTSRNPVS